METSDIESNSSYTGRGWKIRFKNLPKVGDITHHASAITTQRGHVRLVPAKELVIESRSTSLAARASNLIRQAKLVIDGYALFMSSEPAIFPNSSSNYKPQELIHFLQTNSVAANGFEKAARLAASVSKDKKSAYAMAKIALSLEVYSTPIVDLDPHYQPMSLPRSLFASDHVRWAYCIILAYATIEELGLEIRASNENPSRIKGKWNPKVHDNLKERLTKAGINLRDLVLWNRRRSNSRIDRAKSPPIIKKAGWARRNIRDALVDVIEAIDTVGWLRSKVASHRLQNVDALTAYDVANAQFLARRLLLEKLGFWK